MACPYRSSCPLACLGDGEIEKYEPSEGFIQLEDGVLCLDWDVVVPSMLDVEQAEELALS